MTDFIKCKTCEEELPARHFGEYAPGKKRRSCKTCWNDRQNQGHVLKKRQEWVRLIGWPAVFMLVIVTGILIEDKVRGSMRVCVYESIYGTHAVTIDSMTMCPISMEFEV